MANGDWAFQNQAQGLILLLDAHTTIGADNGVWVDVGNYRAGYLIATGLVGGDSVTIDGSNDLAKPANTSHGAAIASAVTSAAPTLSIPVLPRFIKAQVTAKAAGAAVTFGLLVRFSP